MNKSEQKIVQYLNEAHIAEQSLISVLQSQIAMASRGAYRDGLESHLEQTRDHASRVQRRLDELPSEANPVQVGIALVQSIAGQALALGKTPLDLVRGSGGEEKVLKNAKDACATEALEIATYTAIERLASAVGDPDTEALAKSIRSDEQEMLDLLLEQIPKLTDAVVQADVHGNGSYAIAETGAADAVRAAAGNVEKTAQNTTATAKRTARKARQVPGVARAEGQLKGAIASEEDLAITHYDRLNATEIVEKLADLSQIDLAKVDSYERRNANRTTILSRISGLRGDEPWAGYDELSVSEIRSALDESDDALVQRVRSYERAHKARSGVIEASDRELARTQA